MAKETAVKTPPVVTPTVTAPRAAARHAELKAEESRLEALMAPAREYYEKWVNDPKGLECKQIIKKVNAQLGPIKNELAALARAGGSKGIKIEPGTYSKEQG